LRGGDDAEGELRRMLGERFGGEVVLVGSGTQALQTALRAATATGELAGAPVAVPAYSCYDLVSACVGAGVRVEFYDIDPASLSPDWDSLDEALGRGARVVLAGNLYGLPLDWDALRSRVQAVGGLLVEDAAQGIGSEWAGRPGGTFGDATVLSFGRGKGWTGGGGGALLLRDPRLSGTASGPEWGNSRPRGVRSLVGSVAQWALGRPGIYGIPRSIPALALGETVYKPPASVAPISAVSAALVLATAAAATEEIGIRREAAEFWQRSLPAGPWRWPTVPEGGSSAYLRFPIVTDGDSIRRRLLESLDRFGAAAGYPRALDELDAARRIVASSPRRNLQGARILAAGLLTLPTHSRVDGRDRREILRVFESDRGPEPNPA
jgi:dTDP-4-amino-4,6-dideoxygalactose transaminase